MSESREKLHHLKAGDIIFCEHEPGETIFFIKKGEVKLAKVVDDKEKTLAIIEEGGVFGEMSLLKRVPRTATAIAHTDAEIMELGKESFFKLIQKAPKLGIRMLRDFASRLSDQRRKLRTITIPSNEGKVLDSLIIFVERGQGKIISGSAAEITVSPAELAGWAGITEEECQNSLKTLAASHKIRLVDENHIQIDNIDMVKTLLHSERLES